MIKKTTNVSNEITCNINKDIKVSLIEKMYGANIYIPINNKTILVKGYFSQDSINLTRLEKPFKQKNNKILQKIKINTSIPNEFQKNFYEQLSIRDFIVLTCDEIIEKIEKAYLKLIKLKKKNITNIIKDFLTQTVENQIEIISLFLINENDTETQYLAYLMYDMLNSDNNLLKPNSIGEKVYYSMHWSIQKLFKIAF